MTAAVGVAALKRVEALIANPALYELAELVPIPDRERGGRPRHYPVFMWLLYDALLSIYGSARQVEAELAHPVIWNHLSDLVRRQFPQTPAMWLPAEPMRRHHYLYGRTRWLTRPDILAALHDAHRRLATEQARTVGLLDPDGPGSWTHPHLSRMLYADGKVLTPLYRAQPGDTRLDKTTGELRPVRAEPDGGLHFEGTGETAWGTKWVIVAVRTPDIHGRIIVDTDWVPAPGAEAATAMASFNKLAPLCPGAQGVIYDTALRGTHHQHLLRHLGLLPVNKVAAAKAGGRKPRRPEGRRVPKSAFVEQRIISRPDGSTVNVDLFARDGAIGITTLTDTGDHHFTELARVRTHRTPTRTAATAGTTTTASRQASAKAPSPSGSTAPTKTPDAGSTAPRTSDPSPHPIRTSPRSTNDATTPNPSTATSTTPSGSAEPTASATNANTSTSSLSIPPLGGHLV